MDGVAWCLYCGLEQVFEIVRWREALEHAHAIGDLFRDVHAWGLDNPARTIGTAQVGVARMTPGDNGLVISACPGHPLCAACHAPLDVDVTPVGDCSVVCPGCGEKATYALPTGVGFMSRGLRTVIGAEHRTDRPPVRVDVSDGTATVALACPHCGAPVTPTSDSRLVTCGACKTACRVPDRTWWRLRGGNPASESMWLLFSGVSPRREELAETQQRREATARKDSERAEEKRRRDTATARNRAVIEEAERVARAAEAEAKRLEAAADQAAKRAARWALPLFLIPIALAVGGATLVIHALSYAAMLTVLVGAALVGMVGGFFTYVFVINRAAAQARKRAEDAEPS